MRYLVPCLALAVMMAFAIARFAPERMPQMVQGDDALSVAFADAKAVLSAAMVQKADSYFHGGIDMECSRWKGARDHEGHEEHDGHCEHHHGGEPSAPADPWLWINRRVRAPERHVHLDGKKSVELLPWFWASVKADPHNIDAWTTAWYVANNEMKDRDLARQILDEAKAKNPESLEIAWTEARFVYAGGKGDVAEAERLLEAARSMGKRKCGGDLSALSPHEAEAFCGILDYLSKIYEGRGMKDAIRPLIDEVRATGTDSPVAAWMLDRL